MSKTVKGLIEYAKAQVGRPYWYGARGQIATADLYKSLKAAYPSYYTAADFEKQYGSKVHDCSGLIIGYMCSDDPDADIVYNGKYDTTSASMYSQASVKGSMCCFPSVDGVLVFKSNGGASGIHHVGIYSTDGYVYEAKGHAYGVVKTAFKASEWDYWCEYSWLDYEPNTGKIQPSEGGSASEGYTEILAIDGEIGKKTVKRAQTVFGCSDVDGFIDGQQSSCKSSWTAVLDEACRWTGGPSPFVKKLQQAVKDAGYSPGTVDGLLGKKTAMALQKFLEAKGFSCGSTGADGIIGPQSAKAFQRYLNE